MKFDYIYPAKTEEEARERHPHCAVYAEVEGGWAAFETFGAYETWVGQE